MKFRVKDVSLPLIAAEILPFAERQHLVGETPGLYFFGAASDRPYELYIDPSMPQARKVANVIAKKSREDGFPLTVAVNRIATYDSVNIGIHRKLRVLPDGTPMLLPQMIEAVKFIALCYAGRVDLSGVEETPSLEPLPRIQPPREEIPTNLAHIGSYSVAPGMNGFNESLLWTLCRNGSIMRTVKYRLEMSRGRYSIACNCQAWIFSRDTREDGVRRCPHTAVIEVMGYPLTVNVRETASLTEQVHASFRDEAMEYLRRYLRSLRTWQ
jgi:hypothetical protein